MSNTTHEFLSRIAEKEDQGDVRFITVVHRHEDRPAPYGVHVAYLRPPTGDWPVSLQSTTLGLLAPDELVDLRVRLSVLDYEHIIPLRDLHREMVSWVIHHQMPREWHASADALHPATLSKVWVMARSLDIRQEQPPAQLSVQERLRLMRGGVDV